MKITQQITFAALYLTACMAAFSGCSRKSVMSDAAAGTPKIAGDQIAFGSNAPQLGYLLIEPAQERKAVATGLSGRHRFSFLRGFNQEITKLRRI
jgi:hypothetical protein